MSKLTSAQLQQILARTQKQSRISNGFSKMSRSGRRIPKYKLEAGSSQIFIIPVQLGLPFNPFNLEDTSYSANNPFIFQCSVEKAWEICAQLMSENPDLKELFEAILGTPMTEEIFAYQGPQLAKLLAPYRIINPYVEFTCKVTLEAFGQYGKTGAIDWERDADGIYHYSGLLYELYKLEAAFIKPYLDEFNAEIQPGGIYANLNKEQRSTKKQEITANMMVKRPSDYAVVRILAFETSGGENDPSKASVDAFTKELNFDKCEYYIKVDKGLIEAFLTKKGSSKCDPYPSYIEFGVNAGNEEPMHRMTRASKAPIQVDFMTEKLDALSPTKTFTDRYREYRDDESLWDDQIMINSVDAFKKIPDAVLLEAYQSSILTYNREVFTAEIVEKYGDLIRRVSEELADSLENDLIKNKLKSTGEETDEARAFLENMYAEEDDTAAVSVSVPTSVAATTSTTATMPTTGAVPTDVSVPVSTPVVDGAPVAGASASNGAPIIPGITIPNLGSDIQMPSLGV